MSVLFIHGFASSRQSLKAADLREILGCPVIAPDLDHEPLNDVETLKKLVLEHQIKMIVGSSLGGFYALQVMLALELASIKLILINPSLEPQQTLRHSTGKISNFKNGYFDWGSSELDELEQLRARLNYAELEKYYDFESCLLFLAEKDKVLDHSQAQQYFQQATIFIDQEQDHRFANLKKYSEQILNFYSC